MRGRKFYGVCYDPDDDFRACVAVKEGDEAASFGLHRGVVPGGWYATAKVSTPDDIPAAMQSVSAEHGFGDSRPSIEFYHSEIRLY
jgi:DNA gyrase inhibitor GyrI